MGSFTLPTWDPMQAAHARRPAPRPAPAPVIPPVVVPDWMPITPGSTRIPAPTRAAAPPLPEAYPSPEPGPEFDFDPETGNLIDVGAGRIIPRPQDLAPGLPGSRDTMPPVSVSWTPAQQARGATGAEWAAEHQDRAAPAAKVNSPELYGPGGGNLTQADFEGRAQMRRMLDAAYGPDEEPFDPVAAQIASAKGTGDLKLAETRAEDPVAFARLQAEIPERAKVTSRLAGGQELGVLFKGFEDELSAIEQRRAVLRKSPEYMGAKPEVRAAAEAPFDREADRIKTHIRIMQQAMGFATGQTPSSLYTPQNF